jgi:hypothetical protein
MHSSAKERHFLRSIIFKWLRNYNEIQLHEAHALFLPVLESLKLLT